MSTAIWAITENVNSKLNKTKTYMSKHTVTSVTRLRCFPRNRVNLSSPHPCVRPLDHREPLQALPCMGLRPISGPCNLSPKLIWSRARKRSETLALQTVAELVETLMGLHTCPVVGHLLANQVL